MGGNNGLPMKALSAELEAAGLSNVITYIQSGNIVFQESKRSKVAITNLIKKSIKDKFDLEVTVIVISHEELASALRANPFAKLMNEENDRNLHLFFMDDTPTNLREDRIEMLQKKSEKWKLKDSVFYLYTPDGFGKSKLASQVEKILGIPATARNLRTVKTLLQLATSDPDES